MTSEAGKKGCEPGEVARLRQEIDLLTSYFTDTVYQLRYETMTYDYISPSIVNLLGYDPDEIRTIEFRSLILETRIISEGMRKVQSYRDYERKRKTGKVVKWQADYLVRTKDKRQIWVSDISYPWLDNKGAIVGSIGILRDITDRVEAERAVKEELTRLATTDSLTGINNRRVFFDRLGDELKRLGRSRQMLSILLLDIDHFKTINDTWGHDIGDSVLVAVTRIIRACLRETDVSARVGGEEFAAILIDTPPDQAVRVAERMRLAIAGSRFSAPDRQDFSCTVSVGVAGTGPGQKEMTSEVLFKKADDRLYQAKRSGRNRVCSRMPD